MTLEPVPFQFILCLLFPPVAKCSLVQQKLLGYKSLLAKFVNREINVHIDLFNLYLSL